MKTQTKLFLCAALIIASVFFAVTQQAPEPVKPDPASTKDPFGILNVDLNTGLVLGEDENSPNNSPEKRDARIAAILQVYNPAEYYRRFPKTPEQIQAEQQSIQAITTPMTLEDTLQRIPPDQKDYADRAIFAILHPQEAYDEWLKQKAAEAAAKADPGTQDPTAQAPP